MARGRGQLLSLAQHPLGWTDTASPWRGLDAGSWTCPGSRVLWGICKCGHTKSASVSFRKGHIFSFQVFGIAGPVLVARKRAP